MPTSPAISCSRCRLIHVGPCRVKQPVIDTRPGDHARGYGWRWHKIRNIVLAGSPLCAHCHARGLVRLADMVDHVLPLAAGGSHAQGNLQPLCDRCHARKTADDRRRYPDVYKI